MRVCPTCRKWGLIVGTWTRNVPSPPLCRLCQGPVVLFMPMMGRIEVAYEPPDYPDLNDPDVRQRIRDEAYAEAREELKRKMAWCAEPPVRLPSTVKPRRRNFLLRWLRR